MKAFLENAQSIGPNLGIAGMRYYTIDSKSLCIDLTQ